MGYRSGVTGWALLLQPVEVSVTTMSRLRESTKNYLSHGWTDQPVQEQHCPTDLERRQDKGTLTLSVRLVGYLLLRQSFWHLFLSKGMSAPSHKLEFILVHLAAVD